MVFGMHGARMDALAIVRHWILYWVEEVINVQLCIVFNVI